MDEAERAELHAELYHVWTAEELESVLSRLFNRDLKATAKDGGQVVLWYSTGELFGGLAPDKDGCYFWFGDPVEGNGLKYASLRFNGLWLKRPWFLDPDT